MRLFSRVVSALTSSTLSKVVTGSSILLSIAMLALPLLAPAQLPEDFQVVSRSDVAKSSTDADCAASNEQWWKCVYSQAENARKQGSQPPPPGKTKKPQPRIPVAGKLGASAQAKIEAVADLCAPVVPWQKDGQSTGFSFVRVFFATNRTRSTSPEEPAYFGDRQESGGTVSYGELYVSIPDSHAIGAIESPDTWDYIKYRIGWDKNPADPQKHFVVWGDKSLTLQQLLDQMEKRHACSPNGARSLHYVHGFNTSFVAAGMSAAQLAKDLPQVGTVFFFSWPSKGDKLNYPSDREVTAHTLPAIAEAIDRLAGAPQVKDVNILAHSMGSGIVSPVLGQRLASSSNLRQKLRHVAYAAPDVDMALFRQNASAIAKSAPRGSKIALTVYASDSDRAMWGSGIAHRGARAGRISDWTAAPPEPTMETLEVVDITGHITDFYRHASLNSRNVMLDLAELLGDNKLAAKRRQLQSRVLGAWTYWELRR